MSAPRAYFAGFGLHTTLGRGVVANLSALRLPIAPPQRATLKLSSRESAPYYLLANEPLAHPEDRLLNVLANVVAEAIESAGLSPAEQRGLTLFLGTSSGEISIHEALFQEDLKKSSGAIPLIASRGIGNLAYWIMERFGLQGADYTINTACTASANALIHADTMIRSGRIERALVVGVELCNAVTALGFQGLQLLTKEMMRPFDSRRAGLILGEGCTAVVLDKEKRDGGFFLRGAGNVCDTYSVSAANPDGSTVSGVIGKALANARVEPKDITALKAHGTASLLNDEAEVAGMRRVFDTLPPLCALKPRIGHTLGACGLNELALLCGAAREGWLPGTPGVCTEVGDLGVSLNQEAREIPRGNFMLNYFGFGGNNTSLIVSNLDD
ncbi:MAG TPA: beta-ketoacyl synthase N-terminal-like domain-containing protein [Steroidobacteraceae bacterium]|nr:beta-ketoacyl synthase N-terminal-like domain-containing protein [Steroidobacteraceae bacterium]